MRPFTCERDHVCASTLPSLKPVIDIFFFLRLMRITCPDSMKPVDVGLNKEMPYFQRMKSKGAPPITYLHLYECDKFSVCHIKIYFLLYVFLRCSILFSVHADRDLLFASIGCHSTPQSSRHDCFWQATLWLHAH